MRCTYLHPGSRGSFPWFCKLEDFVASSSCRSMPEAVSSTSTSHSCHRGRSGHPGNSSRCRITKFIVIWKKGVGVQAVTVRLRTTSRREVVGMKVSLLFHVIIYRYIHTVGHSVNLTYFPRKLLSKRLCSLKAKGKNRMHGLNCLGYEMCQKWAQVSLGSLLPEGNTENSSAESKYSKMREHRETHILWMQSRYVFLSAVGNRSAHFTR